MPISPAQRFKAAITARLAHAAANSQFAAPRPKDAPNATEYEILLQALGEDLARLEKISSTELKTEFKRAQIEKFENHVNATIAAIKETGNAFQDEIFVRMLVWQCDLGNYEKALEMGELMVAHQMPMPIGFNLPTPAWICAEIGKAAEAARNLENNFPLEILHRTENLIEGKDVPDAHKSRLMKTLAFKYMERAAKIEAQEIEPSMPGELRAAQENAFNYFTLAQKLNPNFGAKKEKEKMEKALAKSI